MRLRKRWGCVLRCRKGSVDRDLCPFQNRLSVGEAKLNDRYVGKRSVIWDGERKIVKAVGIARKCMRIVRQNIVFAIGVKLLFLALTALGLSNMWFAIFADVGVMILAVLNALRIMKGR